MIAVKLQFGRQLFQRLGIELVVQISDHKPDDAAAARHHGAGQRIWPIAKFARSVPDLLTGSFRN